MPRRCSWRDAHSRVGRTSGLTPSLLLAALFPFAFMQLANMLIQSHSHCVTTILFN